MHDAAQVLSPTGRCLLPPLHLGAAGAAFLVPDDVRPTRLLAVAATGALRMWDLRAWQRMDCDCPATASAADLLSQGQTGAHAPTHLLDLLSHSVAVAALASMCSTG